MAEDQIGRRDINFAQLLVLEGLIMGRVWVTEGVSRM